MPRRAPSAAVLAASAGLAGLALPASASALVQVDRGIAGVRIDNTPAQVRAALGRPAHARRGTNDFGPYLEYRYAGRIRVLFQGRRHVSLVSTEGLGDRTSRGVGVGSTERAVRTKVRGITCETTLGTRICHTGAGRPGQRITNFFLSSKRRVTRIDVGVVID